MTFDIAYDAVGEAADIRERGMADFREQALSSLAELFDIDDAGVQREYCDEDEYRDLIATARTSDDFAELGRRLSVMARRGFDQYVKAAIEDECARLLDNAIGEARGDRE